MKSINCIARREPDRDREDKVVDLAAWKAEHLMELEEPELEQPRPERRRVRRSALDRAELASTLAVAAAFLALAVRVLLF